MARNIQPEGYFAGTGISSTVMKNADVDWIVSGMTVNRLPTQGAAMELSLMRPQFFELRSGDGPFKGDMYPRLRCKEHWKWVQ